MLTEERWRHAVEMAERCADKEVRPRKMQDAALAAAEGSGETDDFAYWHAAAAATHAAAWIEPGTCDNEEDVWWMIVAGAQDEAAVAESRSRASSRKKKAVLTQQAVLLRDIFNPFYSPKGTSGRTKSVVALAQAAYEHRALPSGNMERDRLAVLADALEENGCTDREILNHLREPQAVHVRGCWAIDFLLKRA